MLNNSPLFADGHNIWKKSMKIQIRLHIGCELSETEFAHVLIILLNQQTNQVVGSLISLLLHFQQSMAKEPTSILYISSVWVSARDGARMHLLNIFLARCHLMGQVKLLDPRFNFFIKIEKLLDLITVSNFIQ